MLLRDDMCLFAAELRSFQAHLFRIEAVAKNDFVLSQADIEAGANDLVEDFYNEISTIASSIQRLYTFYTFVEKRMFDLAKEAENAKVSDS